MRTFAFGCSLTQYFYHTWADILIHHYKQEGATVGENWGRSGAGNQYISTRLLRHIPNISLIKMILSYCNGLVFLEKIDFIWARAGTLQVTLVNQQ